MRKFVIALLLSLSMPIVSLSQNTYPIIGTDSLVTITPEQLKITNLIFNEHAYFIKENELLRNQVSDLEKLNSLYLEQDSLRCEEIERYKFAYEDSYNKYNRLNKKYKLVKGISLGSILILLGSLLWR